MKTGKNSDILWAPWRMEYILEDKEEGCIFCIKPQQNDDKKNLILYRGAHNFVIMNKYPYNNGHLMVVPYRHIADFEELNDSESLEIMKIISKSMAVLRKVFHPEGFNIGTNIGRIAGAGIDDHLHFHIVPRWAADTNYMPVVGHTKVVSEGLWETWERLQAGFEAT
ncbi:MAG: HIT domain-containing protein [bacterium]